MDKMYKALAEVNRRKIVFWLGLGELNVGEIVKKLSLTQATISNHLSILRKAGLVDFKIKGKERIYKLNLERAEQFVKELNRLMPLNIKKLDDEIIIRR
ncbi:MAG TPA: metalloregulator ArsR/SmtB family transcription factor [Candidatus Methanoperedens sp.]|nr:metalloregulator ArsR/SmtB family transcription factor [Candidatus Methanoperedens sp.]